MNGEPQDGRGRVTGGRPRVLFVVPVEPWCRESGSNLIMADLLEALLRSDRVEILPIFLRKGPEGCTSDPPPGLDGVTLGVEGLPKWISLLRAVARGSSPVQTRFANRSVADRVRIAADGRGFTPDLVHVEHLPVVGIGRTLADRYRSPLVYRAHNIEALLWARRLGIPGAPGRLVGWSMGRAEAAAMRECDLTLCISDVDLSWAKAKAPGARAELLPCSLAMERYDRIPRTPPPHPQIGFVGAMEWGPNEAGLHWFVDEVLPRITKERPDTRLAILARGARERDWITSNPHVDVVPANGEARALFASSHLSVAPLLQGGGVRIKIPESLALGCPVVATTIGAEGLDLPGLTRADRADAFARACLDALEEKVGAGDPRTALRDAVESAHGSRLVAARLVDLWASLLGSGPLAS